MPKLSFKPLADSDVWTIGNRDASISIEKNTGWIRSMVFKRKKVDLFDQTRLGIPGYIGGVRIFDELDRTWYSDMSGQFRLTAASKRGNRVTFTKRFEGAPFEVKVTLEMESDALRWRVEAAKVRPNVPDRSLRVFFQLPLIAGWHCWAPCKGGEEFTFDGMTGFDFMYLQTSWVSDNDIILPMVSHYSKALDVGFSLMEPIDAKVPAARFQFANGERCFNWGGGGGGFERAAEDVPYLEAVNYCIGLVGKRKMATEVMLMFHEGCWRPGLGKVFRRWKEYFTPPNPKMYDYEGVFTCNSLELDFDAAAKAHLKTFEVHDHFEHYSIYCNDKPKWMKNSIKESLWAAFGGSRRGLEATGKNAWEILEWIDCHSDREIAAVVAARYRSDRMGGLPENVDEWTDEQVDEFLYRTPDRIRKRLRAARAKGIAPFWYFNYTDGFRPATERRWPDAISRYEDGSYVPSGWQMCHNLNADPKYSFGKYLIECAKRIVEEYPQIRGFFLDCFRHYEMEFGHDDGVTVVHHKPAYSINFSYDAIEGIVKKILHAHGMCTFANKPQTIRTMRWVDGMMLEGNGDQYEEKYFWSAIAKPIIFLWTTNAASVDENYRRAVLHGCFPKLAARTPEEIRHLDRYMPLFEQFRRRVFCFDPDPVRVPRGSRAKLYTVGKDYVAGVVNLDIEQGDQVKWRGTPTAIFRVQRGPDVGKVGVMLPGERKWRFVKFRFDGTFLFVPLPGYTNCAAVRLFVTKRGGKKIANRPFPAVIDFCGDPQSSFVSLRSL